MISDIHCGQSANLGFLGSLSVASRGSTVRHPAITKTRSMSEFDRVIVTTKLGLLSSIVIDFFQSEQLDYDRSGDRTQDLKHRVRHGGGGLGLRDDGYVEGSTLRENNFCDFRDPLRDCNINFIPLQRPHLIKQTL